jgi:hypothetical protein
MPKYKVVGPFAVFGNESGKEFEADLDEFDETRLIQGGHIVAVEPEKKVAK